MKTRTFRAPLLGEMHDLLRAEGMACAETADSLVDLVVALSRYQEEGVTLYPRFVICDSLADVVRVVPWVGYIERAGPGFRFGVFRESGSPVAVGLRDTVFGLRTDPSKDSVPKVLVVAQLADNVVEILGARSAHLVQHLSAVGDDQPSPLNDLEKIARVVSQRAPAEACAADMVL
ncbi:MAG TPA: hypothetical protein VHC69_22185 [Polyangiaceae bacterium]|nr:hypothetical protein [Polyangiaceae bacterium]